MRTTLTIDDDLAGVLQRLASERGVSFKEIINRSLRLALAKETANRPQVPIPKIVPHSFGFKPGIDQDKLHQVADELESEERAKHS